MINKLNKLLIALILAVTISSFMKIEAENSTYVTKDEKVAIRYKTETSLQGLKFTAKLDETVKNNKHGFFLVYGETTVSDLRTAFNDSQGKDFYLNGKIVYQKDVPNVTEENIFSITLTGIPSSGYVDNISVISYVEINGVNRYSDGVVTSSVAEVAFKSLNSGPSNEALDEIINTIPNKIVYQKNVLNSIELNNTFFELNHKYLKREFNEDFKSFLNKDFDELLTEDDDLINFYKDDHLRNKWSFLLDYLKSLSLNESLNTQITNIKENIEMESMDEFIYALTNFFNEENNKIAEEIIDFTNLNNYLSLKDYNDKVYINIADYKLYQVGDELILPETTNAKIGYVFDHYLIVGIEYQPLEKYVITDKSITVEEVYKYAQYEISFVDEDNVLINVEEVLHNDFLSVFPEYTKEGFVLTGWENDNNEIIDESTKITSAMILSPIFKMAITEITIVVDILGAGVVSASKNIDYRYVNSNHNLHYLYFTPHDGYAFTYDITITVTFNDPTTLKREILKVQKEHIEFAYDDPHWSKRY